MKKLGQGAITTGAGTLIYTVPSGYRTDVMDICISNTTAGALTCAVHLVPVGGSSSASNALFPTVAIPGNTIVQWVGVQTLNAGDFIQGIGSGSGITVNISGEEYRVGI